MSSDITLSILSKGNSTVTLTWDNSSISNIREQLIYVDSSVDGVSSQAYYPGITATSYEFTLDSQYNDDFIEYGFYIVIYDNNGIKHISNLVSNVIVYEVSAPQISAIGLDKSIKLTFEDDLPTLSNNITMDSSSQVVYADIGLTIKDPNGINRMEHVRVNIPDDITYLSDSSSNGYVIIGTQEGTVGNITFINLQSVELTVTYNIEPLNPTDTNVLDIYSPFAFIANVVPTLVPTPPRGLSVKRPETDASYGIIPNDSSIQLFWQSPLNDINPNDPSNNLVETTTIDYYQVEYCVQKDLPDEETDWNLVTNFDQYYLDSSSNKTFELISDLSNGYVNGYNAYDASEAVEQTAVYSIRISDFSANTTVWTRVRGVRELFVDEVDNQPYDDRVTGEWCEPVKAAIFNYTDLSAPIINARTVIDISAIQYSIEIPENMTVFTSDNVDISGDFIGYMQMDISNNSDSLLFTNTHYLTMDDISLNTVYNDELNIGHVDYDYDKTLNSEFNKSYTINSGLLTLKYKTVEINQPTTGSDVRVQQVFYVADIADLLSNDPEQASVFTGINSNDISGINQNNEYLLTPYPEIPMVGNITTTALDLSGETLSLSLLDGSGVLNVTWDSSAIQQAYYTDGSGSKFLGNDFMQFTITATQYDTSVNPVLTMVYDVSSDIPVPRYSDNTIYSYDMSGLNVNYETEVLISAWFVNDEYTIVDVSDAIPLTEQIAYEGLNVETTTTSDEAPTSGNVPFYSDYAVQNLTLSNQTTSSVDICGNDMILDISGTMDVSWNLLSDVTGIELSDEVIRAYKIVYSSCGVVLSTVYTIDPEEVSAVESLYGKSYEITVETGYITSDISSNDSSEVESYYKTNEPNLQIDYCVLAPQLSLEVVPASKKLTSNITEIRGDDNLSYDVSMVFVKTMYRLTDASSYDNYFEDTNSNTAYSHIVSDLSNGTIYNSMISAEYYHVSDPDQKISTSEVVLVTSNNTDDDNSTTIPYGKAIIQNIDASNVSFVVNNNGRHLREMIAIGIPNYHTASPDVRVTVNDLSNSDIGYGGVNDAIDRTINLYDVLVVDDISFEQMIVILENLGGFTIAAENVVNADIEHIA